MKKKIPMNSLILFYHFQCYGNNLLLGFLLQRQKIQELSFTFILFFVTNGNIGKSIQQIAINRYG